MRGGSLPTFLHSEPAPVPVAGQPRHGLGDNDEDNNVYVYRVTQIIDH